MAKVKARNPTPSNQKLWRVAIYIETENGDKKAHKSVLMTQTSAVSEMTRYLQDKISATVILDDKAVSDYCLKEGIERKPDFSAL